jgi:hypothetical protein
VQQAGRDELVAGVALLGQMRRLQGVLDLRHRLAAVLRRAVLREQDFDPFEVDHGVLSLAESRAANCDWRMRVAVSAPADSRIG